MTEKWSFRLSEEDQNQISVTFVFRSWIWEEKRLMSNKTDVVSHHYQSEYQNARFKVADRMHLLTLIKWTCESESVRSSQLSDDHTISQMIRNHSLDNKALIFWLTASVINECVCLSRQWDSEFDVFTIRSVLHTNARQIKVQLVDKQISVKNVQSVW
jgi:hypothetical protein